MRSRLGRRRGLVPSLARVPRLGGGGVGAQDLLLDVLDLHGARLLRQVGQRRLHGDHALDQVLLLVLEAHVEDGRLARCRHVAGHLQRHGRLAGALRPADQHQLARSQSAADRLVQRHEAGGDGHELLDPPRGDSLVQVGQDVQGGSRRERPLPGLELPVRGWRGFGGRLLDHGCRQLHFVRDRAAPPACSWLGASAQRRRVYVSPPTAEMARLDYRMITTGVLALGCTPHPESSKTEVDACTVPGTRPSS